MVDEGESCDDPNGANADGCNEDCTSSGELLWSATVGGSLGLEEDFFGLAVAYDGRAFATGAFFESNLGADFWVQQFEEDGTPGWSVLIDGTGDGHDGGRAATVTDDAVYVAGKLAAANGGDEWVVGEFGLDGTSVWTALSGGLALGDDAARGVAAGPDGSLHVAGRVFSAVGDGDILIRRYFDGGAEGWSSLYDGDAHGYDGARAIAAATSGDLVVGGFETVADNGLDGWTARYRADGELLWAETFQGPAGLDDITSGVAVDGEGSVYGVGHTTLAEGVASGWIRKWAPDGTAEWTHTWGGDDSVPLVSFLAVAVDSEDRVVAAGSETSGAKRGLLQKLSSEGDLLWTERFGDPVRGNKRFRTVAIGPGDHIWAAGRIDLGARDDGFEGWIVRVAP